MEDAAEIISPFHLFLTGLLVGRSHGKLTIQTLIPLLAEFKLL